MKKEVLNIIIAKWFAQEITDTEFKKYVSEEDYLSYVKLRKAVNLYTATKQDLSPDLFNRIKQSTSEKNKPKTIYRFIALSASVAAMLLLFFAVNKFFTPTQITIAANYGENKEVILPDHSKIILGPHSEISYVKNNWERNRELKLQGLAYFEVKKGSKFEVITKNGTIKVLGTKFEVKSIKDYLKVICFEGKVLVTNKVVRETLTPNHQLEFFNNKQVNSQTNHKIPDFLLGKNKYNSVPLKYVLKDIENVFGVKVFANNVDTGQLFTGSYDNSNLDLALEIVLKPLNIKYKIKSGKIELYY